MVTYIQTSIDTNCDIWEDIRLLNPNDVIIRHFCCQKGKKKKNSSSLICGQFGHYSGLKVMIKFEVQSCAGNIPFLEAWAVRVFFYSNMVFFLFKKTNKKIIAKQFPLFSLPHELSLLHSQHLQ